MLSILSWILLSVTGFIWTELGRVTLDMTLYELGHLGYLSFLFGYHANVYQSFGIIYSGQSCKQITFGVAQQERENCNLCRRDSFHYDRFNKISKDTDKYLLVNFKFIKCVCWRTIEKQGPQGLFLFFGSYAHQMSCGQMSGYNLWSAPDWDR